ncbi:PREDICTED: 39S ribosomal protein L39, mitochondrial-like isoform X2 [Priapulus caudatus]|uniref:39S ribosomal protein L39, mitochondrial-like isoform X2 n=1 Tax=Priapulus caudatus TaxID=37621 RepID=A0ABM1E1R5_PRICU|nr:PREDICTED: 39S ribosomal protein L39, mitochondrial-like isoform X2 [Priapulus caudatus]
MTSVGSSRALTRYAANGSHKWFSSQSCLTNTEVRKQRNKAFVAEKKRQMSLITRVEKIKVEFKGHPEDTTLIMNRGLSTPYNCAMHMEELLRNRSALALVDGRPWDMHRPLVKDCELQFLHFQEQIPYLSNMVNKAFWRSGSFLLGYIMDRAFKDQYYVEPHSWPAPDIRSGSFICDIDLKMDNWTPNEEERNCLTRIGYNMLLSTSSKVFERLEVDASVAQDMFADNRFKLEQIPDIAAKSKSQNTVTVYKLDDHIDISGGPMIANSGLVGLFAVSAVHPIDTKFGRLHRVQGLALPTQLKNATRLPGEVPSSDDNISGSQTIEQPFLPPSGASRPQEATT